MSLHDLDRLFAPRRIAVIGASNRADSLGQRVMRSLLGGAFSGIVHPIHPEAAAVQGVEARARLSDLSETPDLAIACTPARDLPAVIEACGNAGVGGVVLLAGGSGPEEALARERRAALERASAAWPGLRILGPDSLGFIVPRLGLCASVVGELPAAGRVAFVSESGAIGSAVLDWARGEGIGFSFFGSLGGMLDLGFAEIIDWLGRDPGTEAIVLYLESVRDARAFMSAARAFTRRKPILVYKAGRWSGATRSEEDAVFDAAFRRAGIERVHDIESLFDGAELLARQPLPAGPRLAIVASAGGPGLMASDALQLRGGQRADLHLAGGASLDASELEDELAADALGAAAGRALEHPEVDALLVVLGPGLGTEPSEAARALAALRGGTRKPILASWMGGPRVAEGRRILREAGIASYPTPDKAVDAFMHLVGYARNRAVLYETPRDLALDLGADRRALRRWIAERAPAGGRLDEASSKAVLAAYGIPVAETRLARDLDQALSLAESIGYPVVLKLSSPAIARKSEIGGVVLDLPDAAALRSVYASLIERARTRHPDAPLEGVTVQPMLRWRDGVELSADAFRDRVFGSVLRVGLSGPTAELLEDRALGLPPLSERLARRLLEDLRAWPLLNGERGLVPVDLEALIAGLVRLSYLLTDLPEIVELRIDPLLAGPEGLRALDARIRIDPDAARPARPYAHLAIRPYPDEWVRSVPRAEGGVIRLRPIRPEDEPRWHALLAACSAVSIRRRFHYLFDRTTHEMAARYCFIDYDREMAIVAEREDGELIGVGRLVTDPGGGRAEYAVLVADAWQGQGLGSLLTDACLEVARAWGLEAVYAETTPDNRRMIDLFRRRGFELRTDYASGSVSVELALRPSASTGAAEAAGAGRV